MTKNKKILESFIPVKSSVVDSVAFDDVREDLYVLFNSGGCYKYKSVSKRTFNSMMKAESKGAFFSKKIRPKFEAQKL